LRESRSVASHRIEQMTVTGGAAPCAHVDYLSLTGMTTRHVRCQPGTPCTHLLRWQGDLGKGVMRRAAMLVSALMAWLAACGGSVPLGGSAAVSTTNGALTEATASASIPPSSDASESADELLEEWWAGVTSVCSGWLPAPALDALFGFGDWTVDFERCAARCVCHAGRAPTGLEFTYSWGQEDVEFDLSFTGIAAAIEHSVDTPLPGIEAGYSYWNTDSGGINAAIAVFSVDKLVDLRFYQIDGHNLEAELEALTSWIIDQGFIGW
jgi:hypothetical protein